MVDRRYSIEFLLSIRERLAGGDHRNAEQHVVADLRRLPRATVARANGGLRHRLQRLFDFGEVLFTATDHERERAALRGRSAAGNRRIG